MMDFKLMLALIQNICRRQAVSSNTAQYCLAKLSQPPYLFTSYVICLYHVITVVFVYISKVKVRLRRHTVRYN